MKNNILTLLFLVAFGKLLAFPISPQPLRTLILESENIVVATVHKTERVQTNDGWYDSKAVLVVNEVLQGIVTKDTITVYYSCKFVCPLPAYYVNSTRVLAFINKQKDSEVYITPALSYGSKTVKEEGLELYKSRIAEMQSIRNISDEKEKVTQTIDWLIKCIKHEETRWEGVYDLYPQGDFMLSYLNKESSLSNTEVLNNKQKNELRKIILSQSPLEFIDFELVDLVIKENNSELTNFLIKCLKASAKTSLWNANMLMQKIALVTNRQDLKLLVQKVQEFNPSSDTYDDSMKKLINEFTLKL
jgi:hypothetical protein